jgi:hypothetical protein
VTVEIVPIVVVPVLGAGSNGLLPRGERTKTKAQRDRWQQTCRSPVGPMKGAMKWG